MKKAFVLFLSLSMLLLLCSCGRQPKISEATETVKVYNQEYHVDFDNCTVSDETYTYSYIYDKTESGASSLITYPDGSTFSVTENGSELSATFSDDYGSSQYADGYTLHEVISNAYPHEIVHDYLWIVILLLIVGFFHCALPRKAWAFEHGWYANDTEPSPQALKITQYCGVLAIVVAIVLFFL